jgi:Zn-dependent protease with chaperone function
VFEFLFEVVFAAIFGATGYKLSTGRRFWMWLVGLAFIVVLFWWRGPYFLPAWFMALTAFGALILLDSLARRRPEAAADKSSASMSGK